VQLTLPRTAGKLHYVHVACTEFLTAMHTGDGLGSIDHPPVCAMVEELLEGGREAFNTRRYLYGF